MELIQSLLTYIKGKGEVWVVGGAVRDHLLGLEPRELDLVTSISPAHLPPSLWQPEGHAFWLDEGRGILRIAQPQGLTIDIAPLQGQDIAADLRRRDFTVNAMAIRLEDWLQNRTALIDPLGGQADLAVKHLRLAAPDALLDDPVRILRGIRLAVTRSLRLDSTTLKAMQEIAPQLPAEPGERIAAELSHCFLHPQAALADALMLEAGVIKELFPEVEAMGQVTQNKYHQFTVDEHSRRAFATFVDIVHHSSYLTPRSQPWFADYWQSLATPLRVATMLAAWLHDIGKPPTRVIRQGRVTFYEHERVGATMAVAIAKRLRLSNAQQELIKCFVRWHMYPMQLWRSEKFGPRHIHRFYRRTGDVGPLIVVFTLADYLAKGDNLAATEQFAAHQQMVENFLHAFFCRKEELVAPQPLLNGKELMSLAQREPGPWLRKAKQALLEAQVEGRVKSKAAAAEWLQAWLRQENK